MIGGSLAVALCSSGVAQSPASLSSSYITPFPQGDRYQLHVIGDWLGNGLASGLQDAFKADGSVEVADESRSSFGLARAEQNGLLGGVDKMLGGGRVDIAVIMLGVNDRLSIAGQGGRMFPGTPEWKEAYSKQAENLIKKLKMAHIAVYWVGLPAMGNSRDSENAEAINDATRQAAYVNGVRFIETWTGFTDEAGNYSAYGPDLMGQAKRLRDGDGIGFTVAGDRKLANYVEVVLRRDLAQARLQRNIPLAGDEEEQARVVPQAPGRAKAAAAATGPKPWAAGADASPLPGDAAGTSAAPNETAQADGKPAEAPVPAVKASASVPRQDQAAFASAYQQQGEMILSDTGNGLTAIAVISPITDFSIRDIQRQTPLADRLYFRVLSKGDALPPKEGRADDFRWQADQVPPQ
jgi:hypothetical protein